MRRKKARKTVGPIESEKAVTRNRYEGARRFMFEVEEGILFYTAMAMLSWLWFALLTLLVVHSSVKSALRTSAGEPVIEQSNWENNREPANCSNTIPEGSGNHTAWEMRPFPSAASYQIFNETRRKLGTFQICSLCTCCGGRHHLCLPSPCCYAINCNIPNRPFGLCSFTPKACNCFGCHL